MSLQTAPANPRNPKRKNSKAKNGRGPKPRLPTPRLYAPPPTDESPRKYGPEVIDDIFRRVSHGETLTQACKSKPNYPHPATVIDWTIKDPEMAQRYAHAREGQTARWADDIVDKVKTAKPETVNVVRLEIDAKKWLLARLKPEKYGDRIDARLANPDGTPLQSASSLDLAKALAAALQARALPPPIIEVEALPVEPSSDEEGL